MQRRIVGTRLDHLALQNMAKGIDEEDPGGKQIGFYHPIKPPHPPVRETLKSTIEANIEGEAVLAIRHYKISRVQSPQNMYHILPSEVEKKQTGGAALIRSGLLT